MNKKIISFLFLIISNQTPAQTFSPLGQGFNNPVRALYADTTDNIIYAGGNFWETGDGRPMNKISKWNGSVWDSLGSGVNDGGIIFSIEKFNGEISVGGSFNMIGNINCKGFSIWNGTYWYCIGDISNDGDGAVAQIKIINNEFYIVGSFDTVNNFPANKIVKWDGTTWIAFPVLDNVGPGWPIFVATDYNNELYVGGNFDSQLSPFMKDIAKWNGNIWSSVQSGLSGFITNVSDMIVFQGELYIGGWFNLSTGDPGNYIVKWDGTSWSQLGSGLDGPVSKFQIFNNELYVGGGFSLAGGVPVHNIAKWNGSQWSNIPNADFNSGISCFTVMGNDLYIGGNFTTVNGMTVNRICKYTPTVGILGNLNPTNTTAYPNPFTTTLTVTHSAAKGSIFITDITGKEVFTNAFTNSTGQQLQLAGLQSGMYFLTVTTNGVARTKKIIKL